MDIGLLNAIEMCKNDPELSSLTDEHPLLLNALNGLDLNEDEIFGILTAVENESYEIARQIETNVDPRQAVHYSSISIETEETYIGTQSLLMQIEDYRSGLLNSVEFNLKLEEQILEISKNFQVLSDMILRKSHLKAEKDSETYIQVIKTLEDENSTLKERLDFLNLEKNAHEQTETKKIPNNLLGKLKKSEEQLQEVTKERNLWKSKAQERTNLARNNSSLKLKTQELEEENRILLVELENKENLYRKNLKQIGLSLMGNMGNRLINRFIRLALENLKRYKGATSVEQNLAPVISLQNNSQIQSKLFTQLCLSISSSNLQRSFELDLSTVKIPQQSYEELFQSLSNNCFVCELNLAENNLGDENAMKLASWLKTDDFLKCLMLRNNNLSAISTSEIIDSVCLQNQLNMIDLSENKININSLINLSSSCTSITDVILENCGLYGDDVKLMLESIKESQLNGFFISYNPIQKIHVKAILNMITKTNLKNLGFSGLSFDETHVIDICNLIKTRPNMEILHLAHVKISPTGFDRILDCLSLQENIRELDLTGTDVLITSVCKLLEICTNLKTIVLREMDISQKDYNLLADSIQRAPQLEVCLLDN